MNALEEARNVQFTVDEVKALAAAAKVMLRHMRPETRTTKPGLALQAASDKITVIIRAGG